MSAIDVQAITDQAFASGVEHPDAKRRRDINRALKRCINAQLPPEYQVIKVPPSRIEHGAPVSAGGKCQRCVDLCKAHR